jgi:hypothetical protein
MNQFYIARFRADPLIHGVPFEPVEGQDLVTSAVVALAIHSDFNLDEPWEIRIAGPFPIGPERVVLADPREHIR